MIQIPQKHIVIVGGSGGCELAHAYTSPSASIWCVARVYYRVPDANYVFEMHRSPARWGSGTMKACKRAKLILREPHYRLPNAHTLPVDELKTLFGDVFTSSFSWMLAYATYLDPEKITLLGVNMAHTSEQGKQRDGLLFLLGYAKAKNIKINVPEKSRLRQGIKI